MIDSLSYHPRIVNHSKSKSATFPSKTTYSWYIYCFQLSQASFIGQWATPTLHICWRSVNFKMVFGVIDFLQKMNKRIPLYYYDTSARLVLVRFWRKSTTPKNHFEINWPLAKFSLRWFPHFSLLSQFCCMNSGIAISPICLS